MTDKPQNTPITHLVIDAEKPVTSINLRELWQHRELLMYLVVREWSTKYKQTVFGVAWVVLQPLVLTALYSIIFSLFIRTPSYDVPYPLFLLVGLIPFRSFMDTVASTSGSLIANSQVISKVYFPRLLIPLSSILSSMVDFAFSFVVLMVSLILFSINPFSIKIVTLPLFLIISLIFASSLGILFAALNVRYRDVGQFLPFVLQFLLYMTPVIYPAALALEALPGWMDIIYQLNPMHGVIVGFRWALLGTPAPDFIWMIPSIGAALLLLGGSLLYFTRVEQAFGEII